MDLLFKYQGIDWIDTVFAILAMYLLYAKLKGLYLWKGSKQLEVA